MKTLNQLIVTGLSLGFSAVTASAQLSFGSNCGCPDLASRPEVNFSTLTDANGNMTLASTTLRCANVYILDLTAYVGEGQVLNVQAGTVIKGAQGVAFEAKSLVVSRGGKIFANGSQDCPIIFTSTLDPLNGTHPITNNAEWGGVILLGKATNNLLLADGDLAVGDGVGTVEGFPTADERNHYGKFNGSFDDNDNSGVLRYVSIRHGGSVVGDPDLGNDINGLTLASVGRGTTLEHIEVLSNFDDGIEFFGGTVDLKYASVLFVGDDSFDYDQGYTGRNQFLFAVQLASPEQLGDEGLEADGDDSESDNLPVSSPTIYNLTLIGNADDSGILAKENFQGIIANSVITNFSNGVRLDNENATDAFTNFNNGSLSFVNNVFGGVSTLLSVAGSPADAGTLNTFTGDGNTVNNSVIDFTFAIDPSAGNNVTNGYDPVPSPGTATTNALPPVDGWFSGASYRGAFAPGDAPWNGGYTLADLIDLDNALVSCPSDINGDGNVNGFDYLIFSGDIGTSCGQ